MTRHKWKLDSVCLKILLILMQDRCTVCAKIISNMPDGSAR
jgi:hypothetical protein